MNVIRLDELGPPVPVRLAPEQARRLMESGVAEVVPDPYASGLWMVRPAGQVGVARVGDVEVWVRPKVRIERLLFLLGYAIDPRGWRDDTVALSAAEDLIPAVAQALWRQGEHAVRRGLLQDYRVHEDSAPVLRGRLRESEQLRRHHGLPIPLEVRYDEFTVDIPENRLLRTAAERMLRVPRVDGESRRRLRHLLSRFVGVSPLVPGRPLPAWAPTRLNQRYHTALRLAEIVLRGASFEEAPGRIIANGFLFDMAKVFEDFATVALAEALRRHGGRARPQDHHHLDVRGRVRMRPDLVWYMAGHPQAVVDAKYKAERPSGFPDADLYQMLAYCTALGLLRGHLVYAKGNEDAARHEVRNVGIEIICHALDLDQAPGGLLADVGGVAVDVAAVAATLPRRASPGRSC
ncbi:MAG: McrC family protein [Streptosporangiaceae bacterium]